MNWRKNKALNKLIKKKNQKTSVPTVLIRQFSSHVSGFVWTKPVHCSTVSTNSMSC